MSLGDTPPREDPLSLSLLICRWVPGTLDRVHVSSPFGHGEATLRDVRRVLGPGAVRDLYLRGAHRHCDHEDHVWYALVCLGCPVRPGDFTAVAAHSPERPPDLAATRPAPSPPVATPPAGSGPSRRAGGPG